MDEGFFPSPRRKEGANQVPIRGLPIRGLSHCRPPFPASPPTPPPPSPRGLSNHPRKLSGAVGSTDSAARAQQPFSAEKPLDIHSNQPTRDRPSPSRLSPRHIELDHQPCVPVGRETRIEEPRVAAVKCDSRLRLRLVRRPRLPAANVGDPLTRSRPTHDAITFHSRSEPRIFHPLTTQRGPES